MCLKVALSLDLCLIRGKERKSYLYLRILINNDLDMHIQAKTNDRKIRRFGDILAPLSRETKLKMRLRE